MKLRKTERTRQKILDTFYRLNENASDSICTVSQICTELDISVSTFYCHFSGIKEILQLEGDRIQDEMQNLIDRMMESTRKSNAPFDMTREKMLSIVKLAKLRRRENLLLLRPELHHPYQSYIKDQITAGVSSALENSPEKGREYIVGFATVGIMDSMIRWLQKQDITDEEFVDILFGLENEAIHFALGKMPGASPIINDRIFC